MTSANVRYREAVLLTNTYPYGTGETFLHEELKYVAAEFKKIYIYPLYLPREINKKRGSQNSYGNTVLLQREIPSNVIIMEPLLKCDHKSIPGLLLYGLFNLAPLRTIFKEFLKKRAWQSFKRVRLFTSYALIQRAIIGNRRTLKEISGYLKENHALLYCYWGDKSAMILPYLKRQMGIKAPFVVRFHGSDIFEEAKGLLPFREEIYSSTDYACPVSQKGAEYIKENYPANLPRNIKVSHLGSINKLPYEERVKLIRKPSSSGESEKIFRIISCSNIIPLKRVELIAKAIILARKSIKKGYGNLCRELQIEWMHIGDGPLLETITQICLTEENIKSGHVSGEKEDDYWFVLTGALRHSEVIEQYGSFRPALFINASRSEGVPVSIMEALSFGVPVIATNVGGTGELFNSINSSRANEPGNGNLQQLEGEKGIGVLIPNNITSSQLAEYILKFIALPQEERETISKNARTNWEQNWDSDKNYTAFAKWLAQLN